MTMVSALELGILIQLIQEDKKLNHSLRNLCSSFFYTDGDTRANGYLDQDGMGQTSAEVLKNASVLYNEISIWATSRKMHSPMNTRECPSVGEQLIRKCRRLGFLGTRSSEALESSPDADLAEARRPIKVFCDGVFDLVHAGHFNALRQAAQLGDELYVGVCSDDEVLKAKGALPLYTVEERAEIVRACKWVTDVIIGTPYDIDMEFFKSTGCDFVAHGDDLALNGQGVDCYDEIRKAGLLKEFKRTEGISTTTIIARLLGVVDTVPRGPSQLITSTRAHQLIRKVVTPEIDTLKDDEFETEIMSDGSSDSLLTFPTNIDGSELAMHQTVLSSRRLAQFLGKPKNRPPHAKVIYTDGSFDILHNGHVRIFEKGKQTGDFLIIGIYDDATVRQLKGPRYPIQPMLDRALSVMAMRCVDEVIMGVPVHLTERFIKTEGIDCVVRGNLTDIAGTSHADEIHELKKICEVVIVDSACTLTTENLLERIKGKREKLRTSIAKRQVKEQLFYNDRFKPICSEL